MSLQTSYTLLAPFYDFVARPVFERARRASLAALPRNGCGNILLSGVGTGLDLPLLPACHRYTALDLTRAMLARALPRRGALDISWTQGDSQCLPFRDSVFDYVILHLILAVVPDTAAALRESVRVTKINGKLLILDKFLKRGETAALRRLLGRVTRHVATRTDVVFEDAFARTRGVDIVRNEPVLAHGWFRRIELVKH